MVVAALLYTLWPLLRPDQAGAVDELQPRIAAGKANLYELEQDVASNNLAATDLAQAHEEMALALYQSAERCKEKQAVDRPGNLPVLLLVCALVPIGAVAIYLQLGQHQLVNGGAPAAEPSVNTPTPAAVEKMVVNLAAGLQQRPDDVTGWTMLARSYMALNRYGEAVSAYEHLHSITPDDPAVLVAYAEALAMANAGSLAGRPQELLAQALQLEPLSRAGLWLSGLAARQSGEYLAAIGFWQTLLAQLQDDEKALRQIEELIAQSESRLDVMRTVEK